jgi:hypothetical protein
MAKKTHPQKKARKDNPTGVSTPASRSSPAVSTVPSRMASSVASAVPSRVASAVPSRVASAAPSPAASAAPSPTPSSDGDNARNSEGGTDEEGSLSEEIDPVKALGASSSLFF